jgi:hypothetical protein
MDNFYFQIYYAKVKTKAIKNYFNFHFTKKTKKHSSRQIFKNFTSSNIYHREIFLGKDKIQN